jgi:hypothetical protein
MTTYWAELDADNIVTQVITGVDDLTIDGIPTGEWYTNFVGAPCVQTFLNNAEKTYAGIGYEYLESEQDFRGPKPYPSWTWSNKTWNPPTLKPEGDYYWNEEELQWVAL